MFTALEFSEIFSCERRVWGDGHMSHEFNVALCGITVQNAALNLSLVGHPGSKESIDKFLDSPCLFPSFHASAHTYASTLDVLTL